MELMLGLSERGKCSTLGIHYEVDLFLWESAMFLQVTSNTSQDLL